MGSPKRASSQTLKTLHKPSSGSATESNAGQHPFDKLGLVWKNVLIALTSVGVGVLLAVISANLPVGEIAKRMTTRIYAPLLTLGYTTEAQSKITVVTLDDLDLEAYDLTWPVPLDYYQRLIDRLVSYQPRAIFLDVVFLDNRGIAQSEKLRESVCRAKQAGVTVYLATIARPDGTYKDGLPGTLQASDVESVLVNAKTPQGLPCVVPTLADITADKLDQIQWQYSVARQAGTGKSPAAVSIFCDFWPSECPNETTLPLALIWGTKAASTNAQTMVARDPQGALQPFCRGRWNFWEAIPGIGLFRALVWNEKPMPLCPYHQVIPIRAFQGKGFSSDELNGALRNKIVMVGADLAALGDSVVSPIHGKIPGVHVHATALDNLIAFKGAYKQDGEVAMHELWHSPTNLFTLFAVLLTATAVGVRNYLNDKYFQYGLGHSKLIPVEKRGKQRLSILGFGRRCMLAVFSLVPALLGLPRERKTHGRAALYKFFLDLMLYLVVPTVILLVGYWLMRQGPLVIIEYVLFPLLAHFTHLGEVFAKRIYLWRCSWCKARPFDYLMQVNSSKDHAEH